VRAISISMSVLDVCYLCSLKMALRSRNM